MLAFFLTIYSEAVCFVAALLFTSVRVLSFLCNLIRQTARCSLLPLEVGAKAVVRLWPICLHISRIFDAMRSSTLPKGFDWPRTLPSAKHRLQRNFRYFQPNYVLLMFCACLSLFNTKIYFPTLLAFAFWFF